MRADLIDGDIPEWAIVAQLARQMAEFDKDIAGVDAQLARLGKKETDLSRRAKASQDEYGRENVQAEMEGREAKKAKPEDVELWRQAGDFASTASAARNQFIMKREALLTKRADTLAASTGAIMTLATKLQIHARDAAVAALKAVAPHLAELLAIEAVYNEHCGGKRVKMTLGPNDAPPFSSEFVVNNFVNKLPVQFRARELDIAELLKAARPIAHALNLKIRQNKDLIG